MKRWRNSAAAILLLTLCGVGASVVPISFARAEKAQSVARTFSQDQLLKLDDYFLGMVAERKIPGAVVLVQQHGKPVYLDTFGNRDSGHPMTADSIFRLYSMSKPITSVAIMMLVEDGKLKLDDPLSKYIPAFATAKVGLDANGGDEHASFGLVPLQRPITIADLLKHTSGITYGFYGDDPARKRYAQLDVFGRDWDNASWAERIAKLPLAEQPGTLWNYGHSTDILGRVIEVVSGDTLYHVLRDRLFAPLGMTDTSFYITDLNHRERVAEPFASDRMVGPVVGMHDPAEVMRWEAGGSGLVCTIADYARFLQMLLNGGTLDGRRYLTAASVKEMTRDHIGPGSGVARDYYYFPGAASGFGYGFAVRTKEIAEEPGPLGEYRWDGVGGTFFWVDPADDMFVLVMTQAPSQRWRMEVDVRKIVYDALK
ncbi:serine hydrolase domain-containing protein [Tardiphaga sp.]|jgi:CubicO group peptidase (beta-lactamase class C family)|uniref:serine hydrolase domain-containing protein n=1 Tax=Tardiphaga sp. TaxID=1926292 RepID=UPI0037DA614D